MDFSDDNPAAGPTLSCSDGAVLEDVVSAGNPAQLVFSDFDVGVSCSITEEPVPGYAVSYSAGCTVPSVADDGTYDCTITNTQNPVTILAAKTYTGEAGPAVTFEASCDAGTLAVITSAAPVRWPNSSCRISLGRRQPQRHRAVPPRDTRAASTARA
jgi:hypothetical protein